MIVEARTKRKKIGLSDLGGLGVGQLKLTADNDEDRELISSIYRCIGVPRPHTVNHHNLDLKSIRFLRNWLKRVETEFRANPRTIIGLKRGD